jgi:hypothetical protein
MLSIDFNKRISPTEAIEMLEAEIDY